MQLASFAFTEAEPQPEEARPSLPLIFGSPEYLQVPPKRASIHPGNCTCVCDAFSLLSEDHPQPRDVVALTDMLQRAA